jgi:hypothetical protein
MNPVFIYMITSILPIPEIVGVFTKGTAGHLGTAGPVLNTFAVLVVEWAILFWMYKRKIFLRA